MIFTINPTQITAVGPKDKLYTPSTNQALIRILSHFHKLSQQTGVIKLHGTVFNAKQIKASKDKEAKMTKKIDTKGMKEIL